MAFTKSRDHLLQGLINFNIVNYLLCDKFFSDFWHDRKYRNWSEMAFIRWIIYILGTGLTRPIFHILGNIDFEIELLMIIVSGLAIVFTASFINLAGIRSGPVEQSARSVFKAWKTSCPWETQADPGRGQYSFNCHLCLNFVQINWVWWVHDFGKVHVGQNISFPSRWPPWKNDHCRVQN